MEEFDKSLKQSAIAAMFRGQELQRREERRERLRGELHSITKRMENEGLLLDEEMTPEVLAAHETAIERMKKQQLAYEKESTPSYWLRLWYAILGK